MFPAFLTTILFSISGVTAMRSTRYLPSMEANFWRLVLATIFLGLYAHTLGAGLGGAAMGWFVISGFIGFGIGDIALYLAYPRLGSRLAVLVVHCVAAPLAALVEWGWLRQAMTGSEMVASVLILSGVAIALMPGNSQGRSEAMLKRGSAAAGVGFALVAAAGQGLGAVLSRRAFETARAAGESIDGVSAAYQRILAGVALSALSYWVWNRRTARDAGASLAAAGFARTLRERARQAGPWVVANALAGPALGVSCFQWALAERGTGVVLPIVALTPLIIIPFSMKMEGERPSVRSLIGGLVAVVGAVIHKLGH
ncbi:MAG: DMT family transporter [Verrucomicrobiales bacterium]|nr:DMT family transporter [Verrucomicrobiales bacterium]